MPAYISHAIFGEDVYYKVSKDGLLLKTPICLEEIRTYSLGADLASFAKNIDPHNQNTQAFFLNMIKYIKEHRLMDVPEVMSLLYGHIAHYFLDINMHPFIYYLEKGCEQVGMISNHTLVEGYLSNYMIEKLLCKESSEVKASYFTQGNLKSTLNTALLNEVYLKTYGEANIINSYRNILLALTTLENVIKSPLITKELLIKISGFQAFLDKNNLTLSELTNDANEPYFNPVTGEKHNYNILELYARSLEMTLDAILRVNGYLYGNLSLSSLEKVFTNLSYDTGVACDLGKNFTFVKQIKR